MKNDNFDEYSNQEINGILKSLSKTNNLNKEIYYHGMMVDYGFNLNKGATDREISYLENKISYKIPSDYKNFLEYTNGLGFHHFDAEILNINEILSCYETFDYPDYMLVIATCMSSQFHIAINLLSSEENKIYVVDPIGDEFLMSLECNFTEFFNRFITSYGSDFWNWGLNSSDKILKNTDD